MFDGMIDGEVQANKRLLLRVPMVLSLLKDEPRLLLLFVLQLDEFSAPIIRRRHYLYYFGFVRIFFLENRSSEINVN